MPRRRATVSCLALLVLGLRYVCGRGLPPIGRKYSKGAYRVFEDIYGRERIFHGTNVVVKGPPWIPETEVFSTDTSLSERDLELMQALGLNVI